MAYPCRGNHVDRMMEESSEVRSSRRHFRHRGLLPSSVIAPSSDADAQGPVATKVVESRARETDWRVVLLGVLLVSAVYVWWHLGRGWIPIDDGPVAHSAERVLQGQLPHRDFDELYTGGLALANAAAFRLLGTNLWTLRLVLFAVFVAWVPALFYIASRFVRPLAAAGVVFLAVVWSVPNYPGAMASWYNLFLATFGMAALFRYLHVGHRRWLVLAGIAGGLSLLVKVIGLYYVAGVLLFLLFHVHAMSRSTAGANASRSPGYATFVSISLLLFVAALVSLVRHQLHPSEFIQFVVPGALLAGFLIRNEWTQPAGASQARFAALARLLVPFLAGVGVPVALFVLAYARAGAVPALIHGVFVVPMRRLNFISVTAPPLATMLALVPFVILVTLAHRARGRITRRETALLVLALALLLRATGGNGALYRTVWFAARSLLPVLVVVGVVFLARERSAKAVTPLLRAQTVLVLAVTALCSLVQFPYSHSVYFGYVAPLVVLATLPINNHLRPPVRVVPGLLVAFFLAFAILRTNSTRIASVGNWYQPQQAVARLGMERGGIEVPRTDSILYGSLVTALRARARGGYTWASPDSPEVYFLSDLKNPTRTLFEVFDDSTNRSERVLRALDARGVTAVVLAAPSFSPAITPAMFSQLAIRYPQSKYIGPFQLRWRD